MQAADLSQLLVRAREGDRAAIDALFSAVYAELNSARSLGLLEMYRKQPRAALPWLEMAGAAAQRRTGGKGVLPLTVKAMHWWARGLAGELDAARAGLAALREPITAITGAESIEELARRLYAGELAHEAGDHAGTIAELREALRIGDAVPRLAQSSFVHQCRIILGASLLAQSAGDAQARQLIEDGIAGLTARDMGWHPWVSRGQSLLR